MSEYIVGGIEGGATHSHAVLMDPTGKIVGKAKGPGTNHHLTGMKECRKRIERLINDAKMNAGMAVETPLQGLGLSLSGCEVEHSNQELVNGLITSYPNLAEKYVVGSDTEGSIATVSNKGGITCIAGTGSNTLLINPDGTRVQCGGWGNLLGDEGSAWKISWRAVKYCFDDLDNFEKPPHPTNRIWEIVKDHFKIKTQADILDSFYQNFDKANIAALAKKIADLARDDGDKLAQSIFHEAGCHLARNISAVVPKAAKELRNVVDGVHVLCVGSVWLSWDLLQTGFIEWLKNNADIEKLCLIRQTAEMGLGAALMASDKLGFEVYRDYSKNYRVLYRYIKNSNDSNDNGVDKENF